MGHPRRLAGAAVAARHPPSACCALTRCSPLPSCLALCSDDERQVVAALLAQHKAEYGRIQAALREAAVRQRQIAMASAAEERKELLAGAAPLGRQRQLQTEGDMVAVSEGVTDGLRRTRQVLTEELSHTSATLAAMETSHAQLGKTREEYLTQHGHLRRSKGLLGTLSWQSRSETYMLWGGLTLFMVVVAFIAAKRIGYFVPQAIKPAVLLQRGGRGTPPSTPPPLPPHLRGSGLQGGAPRLRTPAPLGPLGPSGPMPPVVQPRLLPPQPAPQPVPPPPEPVHQPPADAGAGEQPAAGLPDEPEGLHGGQEEFADVPAGAQLPEDSLGREEEEEQQEPLPGLGGEDEGDGGVLEAPREAVEEEGVLGAAPVPDEEEVLGAPPAAALEEEEVVVMAGEVQQPGLTGASGDEEAVEDAAEVPPPEPAAALVEDTGEQQQQEEEGPPAGTERDGEPAAVATPAAGELEEEALQPGEGEEEGVQPAEDSQPGGVADLNEPAAPAAAPAATPTSVVEDQVVAPAPSEVEDAGKPSPPTPAVGERALQQRAPSPAQAPLQQPPALVQQPHEQLRQQQPAQQQHKEQEADGEWAYEDEHGKLQGPFALVLLRGVHVCGAAACRQSRRSCAWWGPAGEGPCCCHPGLLAVDPVCSANHASLQHCHSLSPCMSLW